MLSLGLVFGLTLIAFLLVIAFMAIGVLMGRREISGSCGGLASRNPAEVGGGCSLCSDPDAACREIMQRKSRDGVSPSSDCELDCDKMGCSEEKIAACGSKQ